MKKLFFPALLGTLSLLTTQAFANQLPPYKVYFRHSDGTMMYGRVLTRQNNIMTLNLKWVNDPATNDYVDHYVGIYKCDTRQRMKRGEWLVPTDDYQIAVLDEFCTPPEPVDTKPMG